MQQTVRVIAGYAVGAARKGFRMVRKPLKARRAVAAARANVSESAQVAGKHVLITGSTRGIGRALAEGFAAAGASVVIHGRRETDAIATASELQPRFSGVKIVGVGADFAIAGEGRALVERAERALGGLDLVINNAGIHDRTRKPIWTTTTDEMLQLLTVNLVSPFETSSAAITSMSARGVAGRIINISTGVANQQCVPDSGIASYGISKIALEGLSLYLSAESKQITVTTLRPSTLDTDMVAPLFSFDERWRLLPAESIVPAALHLATEPRNDVHGRVFAQQELTEKLAAASDGHGTR